MTLARWPNNGWVTIATVQYLSAQPGFAPHLRHRYAFAQTNGQPIWLRRGIAEDCEVLADDQHIVLAPRNGQEPMVLRSIDGGLITPIIRSADSKSLSTISAEMKDLAARAREGDEAIPTRPRRPPAAA